MTAMQILLAKSGIVAHCNLRRFHQQRAQQPIALFALSTRYDAASILIVAFCIAGHT